MTLDRRDLFPAAAQQCGDEQIVRPEATSVDSQLVGEMRDLIDVELAAQQKQAQQRRAGRWRWAAIVAALLLLAGTGMWWWQILERPIGEITDFSGQPALVRGRQSQAIASGLEVRSGDELATLPEESITLQFNDGTLVELKGDTSIRVYEESSGGGRRIDVAWGTLRADVAQQPAGRPLQIETPVSKASASGTELWLSTDDARTRLDVIEGLVELTRQADGQSVTVASQEFAVATGDALSVKPLAWPIDRRDALVLFETADSTSLVRAGAPGEFETLEIRLRGQARLDHDFALLLAGGTCELPNAGAAVASGCRDSSELTIEATITPQSNMQNGPAHIVACSASPGDANFMLSQQENRLLLRLRTTDEMDSDGREIELCRLSANQPQHVAVSYRPGELVCFLNGRRVYHDGKLQGQLSNWQPQNITLGGEQDGGQDWAGGLQGLAIYDRALGAEEVLRNAAQYRRLIARRSPISQVKIVGTLLKKSPVPQPSEIAPATSALMVCRYRVDEVNDGSLGAGEVLVAQWALLNGQPQSITTAEIGSKRPMMLQRLGLNAQLENVVRVDEFSEGDYPQMPRYYEVSPP